MTDYAASKLALNKVTDHDLQRNFDLISLAFPTAVLHVATATTSAPTRTVATYAVLEEMTLTADFKKNPLICCFTCDFRHSTDAGSITVGLHDAGTLVTNCEFAATVSGVNGASTISFAFPYIPATGSRTLDVRWKTSGATATARTTCRTFSILEIRR